MGNTQEDTLADTIADLLFDCELLLRIPSDELFLVNGAAQPRTLHSGHYAGKVRGVWIIVSGEVHLKWAGLSCRLQRGEFFAEMFDGESQIEAVGQVKALWIPPAEVERLCGESPAFRRGLTSGTFRSALVAMELLEPAGSAPALELSL